MGSMSISPVTTDSGHFSICEVGSTDGVRPYRGIVGVTVGSISIKLSVSPSSIVWNGVLYTGVSEYCLPVWSCKSLMCLMTVSDIGYTLKWLWVSIFPVLRLKKLISPSLFPTGSRAIHSS